eukprot:7773601-Pyramimonas_sp.AAC.1
MRRNCCGPVRIIPSTLRTPRVPKQALYAVSGDPYDLPQSATRAKDRNAPFWRHATKMLKG